MKQMLRLVISLVITSLLLALTGCASPQTTTSISTETSTTPIVLSTPISSTTPTISFTPIAITTSTVVNRIPGSMVGNVVYTDNTPANQMFVAIFKKDATKSTATTLTDSNGLYSFSGLSSGIYDVYVDALSRDTLYWDKFDAEISVNNQQGTTIQLIVIPREVSNIRCNDSTLTNDSSFSATTQLSFSWSAIPNTNIYRVIIEFSPTAAEMNTMTPDSTGRVYNNGFNKTVMTKETNITWSPLQRDAYTITVLALDQNGTTIGTGWEPLYIK